MRITYTTMDEWKRMNVDLTPEEFKASFHELTQKMASLRTFDLVKTEAELKQDAKGIETAFNVFSWRRQFCVNEDNEEEHLAKVCYEHWFALQYIEPYDAMRYAYEMATKYYIKVKVIDQGLDRHAIQL